MKALRLYSVSVRFTQREEVEVVAASPEEAERKALALAHAEHGARAIIGSDVYERKALPSDAQIRAYMRLAEEEAS